MQIKVKKVNPEAKLPAYARPGDAGMDLFAVEEVMIPAGTIVQIQTGVAAEIPEGYVGLVWDKSGIAQKYGLKTLGGVVDAGYRGEVLVGVANLSQSPYTFEKGHKIAQMLIQKIENPEIVEVSELSETVRGEGGFGSTGKWKKNYLS